MAVEINEVPLTYVKTILDNEKHHQVLFSYVEDGELKYVKVMSAHYSLDHAVELLQMQGFEDFFIDALRIYETAFRPCDIDGITTEEMSDVEWDWFILTKITDPYKAIQHLCTFHPLYEIDGIPRFVYREPEIADILT